MNEYWKKNKYKIFAVMVVIIFVFSFLLNEEGVFSKPKINSFNCSTNYAIQYSMNPNQTQEGRFINKTINSFCQNGNNINYLNSTLISSCIIELKCSNFPFFARFNVSYSSAMPFGIEVLSANFSSFPSEVTQKQMANKSSYTEFGCQSPFLGIVVWITHRGGHYISFSVKFLPSIGGYSITKYLNVTKYEVRIFENSNLYTDFYISFSEVSMVAGCMYDANPCPNPNIEYDYHNTYIEDLTQNTVSHPSYWKNKYYYTLQHGNTYRVYLLANGSEEYPYCINGSSIGRFTFFCYNFK